MKKGTIAKKDKRRRILLASIAISIALIMVLSAAVPLLMLLFN